MERFIEQLKFIKRTIALSVRGKKCMRQTLEAYINGASFVSDCRTAPRSDFLFSKKVLIPSVSVFIFFAFGGVGFAQHSLPGDFFYPVKTAVNEKARGMFSFGAKAKADTGIKLAMARIEEGVRLAEDGGVSEKQAGIIKNNLKIHAKEINDAVSDLQARGKTAEAQEVLLDFESKLMASKKLLQVVCEKMENHAMEEVEDETAEILDSVRGIRLAMEGKAVDDTSLAFKSRLREKWNKVQDEIREVQRAARDHREGLDGGSYSQMVSRLNSASTLYDQSMLKFDEGLHKDSYALANQAMLLAQEVEEFVNVHSHLGLDKKFEFAIEEGEDDDGVKNNKDNRIRDDNDNEIKKNNGNNDDDNRIRDDNDGNNKIKKGDDEGKKKREETGRD